MTVRVRQRYKVTMMPGPTNRKGMSMVPVLTVSDPAVSSTSLAETSRRAKAGRFVYMHFRDLPLVVVQPSPYL